MSTRRAEDKPTLAAIVGIYAGEKDAERALHALSRTSLAPGYPWVVHTDVLGLPDGSRSGIAIVAGLFATRADAEGWCARDESAGASMELVALSSREEVERRPGSYEGAVVHIDQLAAAPVYAPDDVERVMRPFFARARAVSTYEQRLRQALAPLRASCLVAADSVFLFEGDRQHSLEVGRFGGVMMPVRCGGTVAYVPRTSTLTDAVVEASADGTYHLFQVLEVACDEPTIGEWGYDATGRHPLSPGKGTLRRSTRGGCQ